MMPKYYFHPLGYPGALDFWATLFRVVWFGYTQYSRCIHRQMQKAGIAPMRLDWRECVTADGLVMLGSGHQVPDGAV